VAFSVEKIDDDTGEHTAIDDPNFVEWTAYFFDSEKKEQKYTMIDLHKCDEDDFSDFHEIVSF
jgi:hypothetical protein